MSSVLRLPPNYLPHLPSPNPNGVYPKALTPEEILAQVLLPPYYLAFPRSAACLVLEDLVHYLQAILQENKLFLKELYVTGSSARAALLGESLLSNEHSEIDLDFLGIFEGELEEPTNLKRIFVSALERAFDITSTTKHGTTTHRCGSNILGTTFEKEPSLFERRDDHKVLPDPIFCNEQGLSVRLPFLNRPVDFTLRRSEKGSCNSSARSFRFKCLNYFLSGQPLERAAAEGYEIETAFQDYVNGYFTVVLEDIPYIREGLRSYILDVTLGLRPKDYAYEVEFVNKWIHDYQQVDPDTFITYYFNKLVHYLSKRPKRLQNLPFMAAYLTNLYLVFSNRSFPGKEAFLARFDLRAAHYLSTFQSRAKTTENKEQELPFDPAVWRVLTFWTYVGMETFPAQKRHDSITGDYEPRYWIPFHSAKLLCLPPWKDTAEWIRSNFRGIGPFLGQFGFPRSIDQLKSLLSRRFACMGYDPRAPLFEWLIAPAPPQEDFANRFAYALQGLAPEELDPIHSLFEGRGINEANDPRAPLFRWLCAPRDLESVEVPSLFAEAIHLLSKGFPLLYAPEQEHFYRLLAERKMNGLTGPDPRASLFEWLIAPQDNEKDFSLFFKEALPLFAKALPLLTPEEHQAVYQVFCGQKMNKLAGEDPRALLFQWLIAPQDPQNDFSSHFRSAIPLFAGAFPLLPREIEQLIVKYISEREMDGVTGSDPRALLFQWVITSENIDFTPSLSLLSNALPLLSLDESRHLCRLLPAQKIGGAGGPDPRDALIQRLVDPDAPDQEIALALNQALPLLSPENLASIQTLLANLGREPLAKLLEELSKTISEIPNPSLHPFSFLRILLDQAAPIDENMALEAIRNVCLDGTAEDLERAVEAAHSIRSEKVFSLLETAIFHREDQGALIDFYLQSPLKNPRDVLSILREESRPGSVEKLKKWIGLWRHQLERDPSLIFDLLKSPHFTDLEKKDFGALSLQRSLDQKNYDLFFTCFDESCGRGYVSQETRQTLLAAAKAGARDQPLPARVIEAVAKLSVLSPSDALLILKELPLSWLQQIPRAPLLYWRILQTVSKRPVTAPGLSPETQIHLLTPLFESAMDPARFLSTLLEIRLNGSNEILSDFLAFAKSLKSQFPTLNRLPEENPNLDDFLTSIVQDPKWMKIFFNLLLDDKALGEKNQDILLNLIYQIQPDQIERRDLMYLLLQKSKTFFIEQREKLLEAALRAPAASSWKELKEELPDLFRPWIGQQLPPRIREALAFYVENGKPTPLSLLKHFDDFLPFETIWKGAQTNPLEDKKTVQSLCKLSLYYIQKTPENKKAIEAYWLKSLSSPILGLEGLHELYGLRDLNDNFYNQVTHRMVELLDSFEAVNKILKSNWVWPDEVVYKTALKTAQQKSDQALDYILKNRESLAYCSHTELSALFQKLAQKEKRPVDYQKKLMDLAEILLNQISTHHNPIENIELLKTLFIDDVLDVLGPPFSVAFWTNITLVRDQEPLENYWKIFKPFLKKPALLQDKAGLRAASMTLSKIKEECEDAEVGLEILKEFVEATPENLISVETLEAFHSLAEKMGPDIFESGAAMTVSIYISKHFTNIWSLGVGLSGRYKILIVNPGKFQRIIDLLESHYLGFICHGQIIPLDILIPFAANLQGAQPGKGRNLLLANFKEILAQIPPENPKARSSELRQIWGALEYCSPKNVKECLETRDLFNQMRTRLATQDVASCFLSLQIQILNFMQEIGAPFSEIQSYHKSFLSLYPWLADPKRSHLQIDHPFDPKQTVNFQRALALSIAKHMEILALASRFDNNSVIGPALELLDYAEKVHPFTHIDDLLEVTNSCKEIGMKTERPKDFFERTVQFTLRGTASPNFCYQQSGSMAPYLLKIAESKDEERTQHLFSLLLQSYPWLRDPEMVPHQIITSPKDLTLAVTKNIEILALGAFFKPNDVIKPALNFLDYIARMRLMTDFEDLTKLTYSWGTLINKSETPEIPFQRLIHFITKEAGPIFSELQKSACIATTYNIVAKKLWQDENPQKIGELFFLMIKQSPGCIEIPDLNAETVKLFIYYLKLAEKDDSHPTLESILKIANILSLVVNSIERTEDNKHLIDKFLAPIGESGALTFFDALIQNKTESKPRFAGEARIALKKIQEGCDQLSI